MSRERDRIIKKREKNAVVECNKIQRQFYPELFWVNHFSRGIATT